MNRPAFSLSLATGYLLLATALLAQAPKGTPGAAAGVKWVAPARWGSEAPRPMRVATYRIPPAADDSEAGECGVFFFGTGQGGGVDANVKRWVDQFQQPDGKPIVVPKTAKQQISGLSVTTVDVSGTYTGAGGPMGPKVSKPGYRLLGAIVEAPNGGVFFKLTGPAKTVAAAEKEFQALLRSLRKE